MNKEGNIDCCENNPIATTIRKRDNKILFQYCDEHFLEFTIQAYGEEIGKRTYNQYLGEYPWIKYI